MISDKLQLLMDRACNSVREEVGVGRVANYIPALARVDAKKFGAAIVTTDGNWASYGDAEESFSIQSVSKVFTLTLALQQFESDLWKRVGREPSGNPFNSIVQLEQENGIPRNPFINAGAIVICDALLQDRSSIDTIAAVQSFVQKLADDDSIGIDAEVALSEAQTGHRNMSLAHFLRSYSNLSHPVDQVLDVYFKQCALAMNCKQLARSALYLTSEGMDPLSAGRTVSSLRARQINSIMLLCGHYDASGDFAFRVGLPGKSGVGGAIVAIVPGQAAIAVWSPALNAFGNSHAGTAALEAIVQETRWKFL